jgi:hypothetical protein
MEAVLEEGVSEGCGLVAGLVYRGFCCFFGISPIAAFAGSMYHSRQTQSVRKFKCSYGTLQCLNWLSSLGIAAPVRRVPVDNDAD